MLLIVMELFVQSYKKVICSSMNIINYPFFPVAGGDLFGASFFYFGFA